MRLLQVVPTYFPAVRYGGPIYSVHGLSRALAELGHEVHVATTNVDGEHDSDVRLGSPIDLDAVLVHYFPSRMLRRLYFSPSLNSFLRAHINDYDLVHIHSLFLYPTLAAARVARAAGKTHVISPRGMLIRDLVTRKSRLVKNAWLALFDRRNLETASAVHFTSALERDEAARFGYRFNRCLLVPNGVDLAPDVAAGRSDDSPYIVYVGRLSWKKGLDRLIGALAHCDDLRLVIAGNDDENYQPILRRLAQLHGVDSRIEFVGRVDGRHKARLIANALALVLPSYSENFGNIVLEAMALACPVIVSHEVGLAEVVSRTASGLVVDGEPRPLARGIMAVADNPELCRRMGENGRATVANEFSWTVIARQMELEYEGLLAA